MSYKRISVWPTERVDLPEGALIVASTRSHNHQMFQLNVLVPVYAEGPT